MLQVLLPLRGVSGKVDLAGRPEPCFSERIHSARDRG
jgi:hypothetical protein